MITNFKIYTETVEITPNNTTGFAGDTSSNIGYDGFMRTGNDGNFGIQFSPKGEINPLLKSYKYAKIPRKKFRKNKKKYDNPKI